MSWVHTHEAPGVERTVIIVDLEYRIAIDISLICFPSNSRKNSVLCCVVTKASFDQLKRKLDE